MSLSKKINLTVSGYDIKLSDSLKFYKNDQLKLKFEINEYGINVENGTKVRASMPITPLSAILFIETPLGVDSIESTVIENNTVTFYLSSTHAQHVGISRMQIQLSDEDGCQVTLPPFQFEIRENIYDGEVVLNQVLLADEDNNILVDENGNGLNIGTQVSSQTYAVALSADETKTVTSSIPTKQIQDYDLKIGVKGTEDLLIQDNGITKRMKTSELMDAVTIDISIYYTKEEINTLLENKADSSHTHVVADIADLSIPIIDVDKAYVDTQLETKANVTDIPDLTGYALKTEIPSVPTNTSELVNDSGFLTSVPNEYITETELSAKGYLVSSDIVGKANISDLSSVATTGDYNDLLNKPNVTNGKDGENGATFTPNVDTDGNLSWTNDKELENPTTINIKGPKGDKGDAGTTSWNDLEDKPTDLATESYVNQEIEKTNTRIEELFQSVSNGKELIASALTDKGIPTLATESFEEIARKILSLGSGEAEEMFNLITKNGDSLVTKNGDNLIYKGAM